MYRERAVSGVPGAVLWTRAGVPAVDGLEAGQVRVLPDGCMDLLWADGALLVAGPDTRALLVPGSEGAGFAGLRFAPGTAAAVLGVAAWELRDLRVPLEQLWSGGAGRTGVRAARDAQGRVGAAVEAAVAAERGFGPGGGRMGGAAVAGAAAGLEALVGEWVARRGWEDDPLRRAVLVGARGGVPVAGLAGELGLSERQLRRRSLDLFGYGPRTLGRVLRLERAVGAARAGVAFARVAADAGYADQAHLAREVRALAGVPLGVLLAEREGDAGV